MNTLSAELKYVLSSAVDWLKFAEAKNAATLGVSGLTASAVITFLTSTDDLKVFPVVVLMIGLALVIVSLLVSVISFLPKTDWLNVIAGIGGVVEDSHSLYYYHHVADLDPNGYLQKMVERGGPNIEMSDGKEIELDLAGQVVAISRIVRRKMSVFHVAAWIYIVGLSFLITGMLVFLIV